MKCELCNSGARELGQSLCMPCIEAVARLWTIASSAIEPLAGMAVAEQGAAVSTTYAPIIAVRPYGGFLL
jgi:hypothetical protein